MDYQRAYLDVQSFADSFYLFGTSEGFLNLKGLHNPNAMLSLSHPATTGSTGCHGDPCRVVSHSKEQIRRRDGEQEVRVADEKTSEASCY